MVLHNESPLYLILTLTDAAELTLQLTVKMTQSTWKDSSTKNEGVITSTKSQTQDDKGSNLFWNK